MRTLLRRSGPGGWGLLALALLLGVIGPGGQATAGASSSTPGAAAVLREAVPAGDAAPSAEVRFATPTLFALVLEAATQQRRLYGVGEPLGPAPGGPVVERVEPGVLLVRDPRQQQPVRVVVGAELPGLAGRRLSATVLLEGVECRYVPTPGVRDPEPRLRQLQGRHAVLDLAVSPPGVATAPVPPEAAPPPVPEYTLQTQQRLDGPRLEQVQVRPTGRDSYALAPADVQWALAHAGQVLQEAWGTVQPLLSRQEGLHFRVESSLADGVLGPQGFQVHSPKLAERAGLQAGDIVHSVNGQPVTGFPDLVRLYQEVKRNPQLAVVEVGLERQGQRLTKTYRIR